MQGLGFIGAGAVLHNPSVGLIHGLTTAASLWIVAALGLAVGRVCISFFATWFVLVLFWFVLVCSVLFWFVLLCSVLFLLSVLFCPLT